MFLAQSFILIYIVISVDIYIVISVQLAYQIVSSNSLKSNQSTNEFEVSQIWMFQ